MVNGKGRTFLKKKSDVKELSSLKAKGNDNEKGKNVLLLRQLRVASTSLKYYRDCDHKKSLMTLIIGRDMIGILHQRDSRERLNITYCNKGTKIIITHILSGIIPSQHHEYGDSLQEPNQNYETQYNSFE